jgi:hypothetical protein
MPRLLSALLWAGLLTGADWASIQPDASFKNWTRLPMPPSAPLDATTQWTVARDGDLLCDGTREKGHEWLRYDRELSNFVLHVEWKFRKAEGETKYNSGVYVRNSADGSVWHQAQIGAPGNGGYFFYNSPKRINLKSDMPTDPLRPPGEWNTYEITVDGPHVTLVVNGTKTSEFDCERKTGYIGLEAEHYRIEFRHIKLKELP